MSLTEHQTALITGVAGQDGSYLSEHLLEQGFIVHGIIRRSSVPEHQESRVSHLDNNAHFHTHYGDVTDMHSLLDIFSNVKPDFIFNLAAQSHVKVSFQVPAFTAQTNAIGVLNVLEAARIIVPNAHTYQASSSEMWGSSVDADGMQRESTPFNPVSPYGIAKLYSFHMVRSYRNGYGMFAANGILANHESPRRGSNFVTAKVCKQAVEISLGLRNTIELGNIKAKRDWGDSRDFIRAMLMILQADHPDDWVVSTGVTRSVEDMAVYVFQKLGLDFYKYLRIDERLKRAQEVPLLCCDSSRIRRELGWAPTISFEQMMDDIVALWQEKLRGK